MRAKNSAGFSRNAISLAGLCLILSAIIYLSLPAKDACAQIAATPCDPDYYQALEQRAWLEAQREVVQNQNLITKPDSVLGYTCFDGYLRELADHADEMFSESPRWGASILGGTQDESMNRALEDLVLEALISYMDANFIAPGNRRQLGGRLAYQRPNINASIPNGQNYTCSVMQDVWMQAKCYNFQQEPGDGFFTFENYETTDDKRAFPGPQPCGGSGNAAGGLGSVFATARAEAGLVPTTAPVWPVDQTFTYFDRFDPTFPSVTTDCGTHPPVETGVQVNRPQQNPTFYHEHVCVMAGCHFRPPGAGGAPPASGYSASFTCFP